MNPIDELKHANIEVLYEMSDVYPYAYDTAPVSEDVILPDMVIFPKNTKDVQFAVRLAKKYNLKVISRGAGTCHTSGCKPAKNSIVLHFSKMNKILDIDSDNLTATVQPGVIVGQLQNEVDRFGLFFPPDPSNLKVSTIGGAVALSSGGARAFKYGTTKDYVINLEAVLADGSVLESAKDVQKNVAGYNLTSLFTGSEGTLGIITKITLKLIPKPETSLITMAYFNSLEEAAMAVNKIIRSKITPASVDLLDKNTIDTIEKFNPTGLISKEAMLLIETDGINVEVKEKMKRLYEVLKEAKAEKIVQSNLETENERILTARRSAFACVAKLKPNVVTEDVVVPKSNIVTLIKEIKYICEQNNITVCIMGHAGDGNIHPNFALDFSDKDEMKRFNVVKDRLFELAVLFGGTISGEHGIGFEKKKYLQNALDIEAFNYMKKIKALFDPDNMFNPELMF